MPSDVRFAEVRKLYLDNGWRLDRVNSSHHIFKAPSGRIESVPVHDGKVKHFYVRKAQAAIEQERQSGQGR